MRDLRDEYRVDLPCDLAEGGEVDGARDGRTAQKMIFGRSLRARSRTSSKSISTLSTRTPFDAVNVLLAFVVATARVPLAVLVLKDGAGGFQDGGGDAHPQRAPTSRPRTAYPTVQMASP